MKLLKIALSIAAIFVVSAVGAQGVGTVKGSIALVGGTVYIDPVATPIENGTVLIRDGVIVAVDRQDKVRVPRGTTVIDCAGMTVTAGFWNSHVHFHERKWFEADKVPAADLTAQLKDMLTQRGFTSVYDTWSNFGNTTKLRARIESGEVSGPRIRTTGEALMHKGG
ncbi:MAG TPA: hypothetical protein VK629_19500, partial [Steroidobacteraceae bacterium]|nr:hypothetical protein [Steroidobacteraceae bacterium]